MPFRKQSRDRQGQAIAERGMRDLQAQGGALPPKRREGSLGLRLVETLVRQIRGTAAVEPQRGGEGTAVVVVFSDPSTTPGV